MDLIDALRQLAASARNRSALLQSEEATKNALVLPFLQALGYDVFNPGDVMPEYTADFATKKGEKVDYAILKEGQPAILIECKRLGSDLDADPPAQLYRYFSVTEARFGIVTDGVIYRFYSDLEQPNVMDQKPFLEFNLFELQETIVDELKKFGKDTFNLDAILSTAADLKYTSEIKKSLGEQWANPSDEFVRYLVKPMYSRPMTRTVREQFKRLVKRGLQEFLRDRINDRLKLAMSEQEHHDASGHQVVEAEQDEEGAAGHIVTTEDEIQAFYIVKAILASYIDPPRVTMRDWITYCNVLLDGKQQKVICRFQFKPSRKRLGLIDQQKKTQWTEIARLDDIFRYSETIKETALKCNAS